MFRRTGFTALYLDIEHQPNVADPVGVKIAVPAWLGCSQSWHLPGDQNSLTLVSASSIQGVRKDS